MNDNVRLLEELVSEAVGRLERLRTEREALRGELDELRKRLEASRQEGPDAPGKVGADGGWPTRRARALDVLKTALADLNAG